MQLPVPFFREVGSGPGVVCLHSNASTSSQWQKLMEFLAPKFHVLAADSFGAGKSPAWPTDRPVSLQDEVALLEPVFVRAGDPYVLVAHSYGAAVALIAAVLQPHRIRILALYEPMLFALLDANLHLPMMPMVFAELWPPQLLPLTQANYSAQRNASSTSGWAKVLGLVRLNRAKAQFQHPLSTFAGGQGHCSMSPHLLRRCPS